MKTFVRDSVFESNSSSSHAIVVSSGDVNDLPFDHQSLRKGLIRLTPDPAGYDQAWVRYRKPESILCYLITVAAEYIEWEKPGIDLLPKLRENPKVDRIIRAAMAESRCVFEFTFPETDWKSGIHGSNRRPAPDVVGSAAKFRRLLFNKASYIQTGSDSGRPPYMIEADTGTELFDPTVLRENVALDRWFKISAKSGGKHFHYFDDEGHEHAPKLRDWEIPQIFGDGPADAHVTAFNVDWKAFTRKAGDFDAKLDVAATVNQLLFSFVFAARGHEMGIKHGFNITMPPHLDIGGDHPDYAYRLLSGLDCVENFDIAFATDTDTIERIRTTLIDAYSKEK